MRNEDQDKNGEQTKMEMKMKLGIQIEIRMSIHIGVKNRMGSEDNTGLSINYANKGIWKCK